MERRKRGEYCKLREEWAEGGRVFQRGSESGGEERRK